VCSAARVASSSYFAPRTLYSRSATGLRACACADDAAHASARPGDGSGEDAVGLIYVRACGQAGCGAPHASTASFLCSALVSIACSILSA
jgi:hypothetical protein